MATYYRRIDREIQVSEATAAKRTVIFEVGTHEAQTVTVSKAGGAFGSSTTTATQVDGNLYRLAIAAADLDTEGELAFKCVGATDTQYVYGFMVVDHDPFDAIAAILDDTGTSGVALADGVITAAKLGADCITSAKIADDAILAEHVGSAVIVADTLGADCITSAKIADDAILAEHVGSAVIVADTLGADCITEAKIADDAIAAEHIASAAIVAGTLGADCITSAKIADDAIAAEHLADDTITAASIATDAIAADGLADGAAGEIADKVLKELVADHKGTAGSFADVLNDIWRRIGFGLRTTDTDDDTIKTYDGTTDGDTLLVTETKSEAGSETDWTPS